MERVREGWMDGGDEKGGEWQDGELVKEAKEDEGYSA